MFSISRSCLRRDVRLGVVDFLKRTQAVCNYLSNYVNMKIEIIRIKIHAEMVGNVMREEGGGKLRWREREKGTFTKTNFHIRTSTKEDIEFAPAMRTSVTL